MTIKHPVSTFGLFYAIYSIGRMRWVTSEELQWFDVEDQQTKQIQYSENHIRAKETGEMLKALIKLSPTSSLLFVINLRVLL